MTARAKARSSSSTDGQGGMDAAANIQQTTKRATRTPPRPKHSHRIRAHPTETEAAFLIELGLSSTAWVLHLVFFSGGGRLDRAPCLRMALSFRGGLLSPSGNRSVFNGAAHGRIPTHSFVGHVPALPVTPKARGPGTDDFSRPSTEPIVPIRMTLRRSRRSVNSGCCHTASRTDPFGGTGAEAPVDPIAVRQSVLCSFLLRCRHVGTVTQILPRRQRSLS